MALDNFRIRLRELPKRNQYTSRRLRELLQEADLTQADCAELLQTSKRNIEKYVLDADRPSYRAMPDHLWQWLLVCLEVHPFIRAELKPMGESKS